MIEIFLAPPPALRIFFLLLKKLSLSGGRQKTFPCVFTSRILRIVFLVRMVFFFSFSEPGKITPPITTPEGLVLILCQITSPCTSGKPSMILYIGLDCHRLCFPPQELGPETSKGIDWKIYL